MIETLKSGGILIIPILICGVLATFIIIERCIYFANIKNLPSNLIKISITAKRPSFFSGLEYVKAAPKYGFFTEWKRTRERFY